MSDSNANDNQDPSPVDAGAIAEADASELAALASQASDEQLAEAMSDPENRKRVLDEIFGRMADHIDPAQIKDVDAVVQFKITGAPDGGADVYEAVIKDGAVTVSDEPSTENPKLAIIADSVPFLKLVTGQEAGPVMFMSGKLKIEGDLMFASRMTSFFRIPSAA